MPKTNSLSSLKVIGANGQISLGKRYAGKQVLIEQQKPGTWLIRMAKVIPDTEYVDEKICIDLENSIQQM